MNLPNAPIAQEGFFAAHYLHGEDPGKLEGLL